MYRYDNFIFDLDGTIINSSKEVLKLIAPDLNEKTKIDEIEKIFHSIYDFDEKDITELYDGIYDLLTKLKKDGKKLFMATLKPKIPTERLLKQFNLNMFDDVFTIDKFEKDMTKTEMMTKILTKYNLNPQKTVMIGDAPNDMTSAKAVGIKAIGVLWGYGENKNPLKGASDFTA